MSKIALVIKTTGKNITQGKILSLHMAEFNELGHLTGKRFYTPINPQAELPDFIELYYGLTADEINDSRTISEIKEDFLAFIGNKEIVCYDALSTQAVLERELRQPLSNHFIDLKSWVNKKTNLREDDVTHLMHMFKLKDSDFFNFKEEECDLCVQLYAKLNSL